MLKSHPYHSPKIVYWVPFSIWTALHSSPVACPMQMSTLRVDNGGNTQLVYFRSTYSHAKFTCNLQDTTQKITMLRTWFLPCKTGCINLVMAIADKTIRSIDHFDELFKHIVNPTTVMQNATQPLLENIMKWKYLWNTTCNLQETTRKVPMLRDRFLPCKTGCRNVCIKI